MTEETCSACKFCRKNTCHRYPPQVVAYVESSSNRGGRDGPADEVGTYTCSESPAVQPDGWCGEFKPKATTTEPYDPAKLLAVQPKLSPELDAYLQAKAEYDAACQAPPEGVHVHNPFERNRMSDFNIPFGNSIYCHSQEQLDACEQWAAACSQREFEFKDRLVVPLCPCCGQGRTLFVRLKVKTPLVIDANFRDWCDTCKQNIAAKLH